MVEIKSVAAPDRAWKSPGPNGHGGGVRILVDYRETALWSELSGRWADHKAHGGGGGPAVTLEQAPLLVGDVELTAAAGPLVRRWIWERKSLADLSASIVDGRWTEQRRRMCSAYPVGHVHYLIEGNPFDPEPELEPKFGVSDAAMRSALLRVQLDEGVHVHHCSTSPRPSSSGGAVTAAEYISRAVEGILRGVQEWARGGRAHGGTLGAAADVQQAYNDGAVRTAALDVKKGANVTPELCYLQQLVQIPGVSVRLARTVQARFPTLRALVEALAAETDPKKRRLLFSSLDGIGAKRADTIVRSLGFS